MLQEAEWKAKKFFLR